MSQDILWKKICFKEVSILSIFWYSFKKLKTNGCLFSILLLTWLKDRLLMSHSDIPGNFLLKFYNISLKYIGVLSRNNYKTNLNTVKKFPLH